jgi:tRNA-Thr(GGU) m(6)t(6)A37 methyltransferase TsaA
MIVYQPIGVIHSPFLRREGTPIQPRAAKGIQGWIEVHDDYTDGLQHLEGFSHIVLLYHFHLSDGFNLQTIPFLDNVPRGIFATRAPQRPNAIGVSTVKLVSIKRNILEIENVDVVDGTPLLDIKPYISDFDAITEATSGWYAGKRERLPNARADDRFCENE